MNELSAQNHPVTPREKASTGAASRKAAGSGCFKYYIHDGTECCRLQLFGDATEAEVAELTGCWQTAKTCLGGRRLVLDLRGLRSADDLAKRWLLEMANDGASFLPDSYLRDGLNEEHGHSSGPRLGLFARICSLFRRSPVVQT
jgi:hypothetical protein